MFEQAIETNLKAIFGVKKVTFSNAGESAEQECLFIEADKSEITFSDGRAKAKVMGKITMFGNSDKLTFGFFPKSIAKADASLTRPFFFYDFEENTRRIQNIVQRACSFVYFFDTQYDPETGTITEIDFTTEEHP